MRAWVSERPTIPRKAKWTPEQDEKLLELRKKFIKWEKISNELSHTPFECVARWSELSQQMLKAKTQQQMEPKLMFPPSENWDPQSSRSASQLVSKAHKEAVNSLSGSGSAQLAIVAADNSAHSALRATREIDAATISSVRNILGSVFNISVDNQVDDPAIIKLRECEEKAVELCKERDQLVKQKDSAIQEALLWRIELEKARDHVPFLEAAVKGAEERARDQLVKQKDSAIQEALLWRIELEKARDHVVFLEAAVRGAEERARNAEIDAEAKDMEQRKTATLVEKQLLLAYINALQAQVQRSIKDVEWSDKNLDKPSKRLKISSSSREGDRLHLLRECQGYINPTTDDAQWKGNQATLDDLTTTDDCPDL